MINPLTYLLTCHFGSRGLSPLAPNKLSPCVSAWFSGKASARCALRLHKMSQFTPVIPLQTRLELTAFPQNPPYIALASPACLAPPLPAGQKPVLRTRFAETGVYVYVLQVSAMEQHRHLNLDRMMSEDRVQNANSPRRTVGTSNLTTTTTTKITTALTGRMMTSSCRRFKPAALRHAHRCRHAID